MGLFVAFFMFKNWFFSPNLKCLPSVLIFPSLTHCHTVKAARVRQAEKRSRRKTVKKGDGER